MKGIILEPTISDENVIVQVTKDVIVDKQLQVKVPTGFQAIVFVDEKQSFRVEPTNGELIFKRDKSFLKKQCRVAFVRKKLLPSMHWGCGPVQVNNERLQEAYPVGANGKYSIEIKEIAKLFNGFDESENFTIDDVRERTISTIKNVGVAVLGKFFANTNISLFEISAHIDEIRKQMYESLLREPAFAELGVKIKDITVAGVHIPEEDVERIKNRINGVETYSEKSIEEEKSILKINEKIEEIQKALSKLEENRNESHVNEEELERQRKELEKTVASLIADSRETLHEEIEDSITSKVEAWQESVVAGFEEKLQALSSVDVDDKVPDYSLETILENAKGDNDFSMVAGGIHTAVEDALINEYGLINKKKKFITTYLDYIEIANEAKLDGEFLLKKKKGNSYEIIEPKVFSTYEDGSPNMVEMLPIVRYLKAGLSPEDAKRAEQISVVINKLRHPSDENKEFLERFFVRIKQSKKEYLKNALSFLKETGLYIVE